jgi:hypothetical protein
MRLTIIPIDKTVYKDSKSWFDLDLSLCGIPDSVHALQWDGTSGWIEYKTNTENQAITELPDWALACLQKWEEADAPKAPVPLTAEDNKLTATINLQTTDWAVAVDVGDPTKASPHLVNMNEFIVYRNLIRQHAINPVAGDINWPIKPTAVWST